MTENITTLILATITLLAISGVFVQIARFIAAKMDGTKYENAANAVLKAVEYVNQTFVDELKENGEFDKAAQADAMERAILAALEMMGDKIIKYVEKTFGNVEEWIKINAEAYIAEAKK